MTIRKVAILFCDNEHGTGDVAFPPVNALDEHAFIEPMTTRQLRAVAKKQGWKFKLGRDWCPDCAEDV